jgi:hypothetical protein
MIYKNGFPSTVLIHCGENHIGDIPCGLLLQQLRLTFATLIELIPGVLIIWSCILPRISWRFSQCTTKMERIWKRINRGISSFLLKYNCYVVKHPDFNKLSGLFANDGVISPSFVVIYSSIHYKARWKPL